MSDPDLQTTTGPRRYALVRSLGSGEFGEVFAARDREHGGMVALKVLRRCDPEWLYRFKREFRQVADIAHPNLVRLYELFEEDKCWYLAMELVDGLAFNEHLARAPEQIESCFSQLAGAISALHKAGTLHRDIKPMNAMVEASGRVVLLDFGLAYGVAKPEATAVAGTPHYMAPEQWFNELSEATDWYAFGMMLYESLSGGPVFEGTGMELFRAKQRGPKVLDALDCDPRLAGFAMRLLASEPSERPSDTEVATFFQASTVQDSWISEQLPFVGRQVELEQLRTAVADVPAAISVIGDAGIGKTALVKHFLEGMRRDGAVIYEGRCHETESAPYKGIDGVIDMLCNDLRNRNPAALATLLPGREYFLPTMFPVLKRVGILSRTSADEQIVPHAKRLAAIAELRSLLTSLAAEAPLVLFVDDVQWAGPDTYRLLEEVMAAPAPPLALILTARPGTDAVHALGAHLETRQTLGVTRIELAPLNEAGVSELLAKNLASFDTAAAWKESKGHPYLLTRMLAGGAATGLTASLEGSLASLSADARAVLNIVATAGRPLPQAAAFAAAKLGGWRAEVVDELRRRRLVQTRGLSASASIEPYHDRVRESVLASFSAEELRHQHQALAHYFEENRRVAPHALAHHYQAAGDRAGAQYWLLLAARDAVKALAFARADELYGQAVDLASSDEAALRVEWAEAMVLAGSRARAAALYLEASTAAAQGSSASSAAELRTRSGEEWILSGYFERGISLIEDALNDAGVNFPADNATAMSWALNIGAALSVRGLHFIERPEETIDRAALRRLDLLITTGRALAMTDLRCGYITALALHDALELGEVSRVQEALCHFVIGASARAADHPLFSDAVARALELAEQLDSDLARTWALTAKATLHTMAGDVGDAFPMLTAASAQFSRLDPPMLREAGAVRILSLACAAIDGAAPRFAVDVAADWLNSAESRDDLFVANWLRLIGARVRLIAGDHEGALIQAAAAKELWSHLDDNFFVCSCFHAEMFIRVYADPSGSHRRGAEIETAMRRLFAFTAPIGRSGFYVAYGAAITAAGASGTLAKTDAIERLVGVIERLGENRYHAPAIPGLRSQLAMLSGDRAAASALMAASAAGWDERKKVLHAAAAHLRHAQLTRDQAKADRYLEELREMGVGDPSRYATTIAGPPPPP